jgi:hypothetical protein
MFWGACAIALLAVIDSYPLTINRIVMRIKKPRVGFIP